jgi:SARP family transcriptional regulator, regulator of embCAB operon
VTPAAWSHGADGAGSPDAGLRLPVHAAARAAADLFAADLFADPRRFTVRSCPGTHCGWLFLDESGLRRFCSIATCGKRPPDAS